MARTLTLPARAIKAGSLTTANDPPSLTYASGKPPVPSTLTQRPADDGSMSDGTTGGNFQVPTVSTGAGQGQAGIDSEDPNK
ncbi:MAG: hypothetical protein ACLPQ6_03330 [Steroidobacteraceae bacterium]|jgi:hypothetical protein